MLSRRRGWPAQRLQLILDAFQLLVNLFAPGGGNVLWLEFYLCLSRACLGKMIVSISKVEENRQFSRRTHIVGMAFSIWFTSSSVSAVSSCPTPRRAHVPLYAVARGSDSNHCVSFAWLTVRVRVSSLSSSCDGFFSLQRKRGLGVSHS